jgi:hypothetical protein
MSRLMILSHRFQRQIITVDDAKCDLVLPSRTLLLSRLQRGRHAARDLLRQQKRLYGPAERVGRYFLVWFW